MRLKSVRRVNKTHLWCSFVDLLVSQGSPLMVVLIKRNDVSTCRHSVNNAKPRSENLTVHGRSATVVSLIVSLGWNSRGEEAVLFIIDFFFLSFS